MPGETQDPEVIREEIEETRTELGRTVEALAARANVKTQARETVASLRDRVRERPAIAYAAAAVLLLWILRRVTR
jgi:hypothetical protein